MTKTLKYTHIPLCLAINKESSLHELITSYEITDKCYMVDINNDENKFHVIECYLRFKYIDNMYNFEISAFDKENDNISIHTVEYQSENISEIFNNALMQIIYTPLYENIIGNSLVDESVTITKPISESNITSEYLNSAACIYDFNPNHYNQYIRFMHSVPIQTESKTSCGNIEYVNKTSYANVFIKSDENISDIQYGFNTLYENSIGNEIENKNMYLEITRSQIKNLAILGSK